MTWEASEQLTAIIFNSSAIVVGIALVLIATCWRTLKQVLSSLPKKEIKEEITQQKAP